jgi:hypothetical protein
MIKPKPEKFCAPIAPFNGQVAMAQDSAAQPSVCCHTNQTDIQAPKENQTSQN